MGKLTKEQAELALKWQAMVMNDPDWRGLYVFFNTELQTVKSYEEFKTRYPVGSNGWLYFMKWWRYAETLGVLVHEGLIPVEFVLDALGGSGFGNVSKMIAEGRRKEFNNPLPMEHWQWLSQQVNMYTQQSLKRKRVYEEE